MWVALEPNATLSREEGDWRLVRKLGRNKESPTIFFFFFFLDYINDLVKALHNEGEPRKGA